MTTKEKLDAISNLADAMETNVRVAAEDFQGDTVSLLELSLIQSSIRQIDRHLNRLAQQVGAQRHELASPGTTAPAPIAPPAPIALPPPPAQTTDRPVA